MKKPTKRAVNLAAQKMHDARMKYGNHDAVTARAEIAYWEAKEAWENRPCPVCKLTTCKVKGKKCTNN